jgi:hypothetical protein
MQVVANHMQGPAWLSQSGVAAGSDALPANSCPTVWDTVWDTGLEAVARRCHNLLYQHPPLLYNISCGSSMRGAVHAEDSLHVHMACNQPQQGQDTSLVARPPWFPAEMLLLRATRHCVSQLLTNVSSTAVPNKPLRLLSVKRPGHRSIELTVGSSLQCWYFSRNIKPCNHGSCHRPCSTTPLNSRLAVTAGDPQSTAASSPIPFRRLTPARASRQAPQHDAAHVLCANLARTLRAAVAATAVTALALLRRGTGCSGSRCCPSTAFGPGRQGSQARRCSSNHIEHKVTDRACKPGAGECHATSKLQST